MLKFATFQMKAEEAINNAQNMKQQPVEYKSEAVYQQHHMDALRQQKQNDQMAQASQHQNSQMRISADMDDIASQHEKHQQQLNIQLQQVTFNIPSLIF